MTPADRQFWLRAQRRAAGLEPDVAAALLRALMVLRASLSDEQIGQLILTGSIERVLQAPVSEAVLDRAFLPLRERLRYTVERGVRYTAPDLPKGGKVNGVLAVEFNVLNPKVIDAIRTMDTRVIHRLKTEIRDVVRAHVENGLRDGVDASQIARGLRDVIGLAPHHEEWIRNFRSAAASAHESGKAFDYKLRDRRFDSVLRRAHETGVPIPAAKIDQIASAYRRKAIALNAETNARTATMNALRLGQRLTWDDAVDKGIVDRRRLMKRRRVVLDGRERPEHHAMSGEVRRYDEPYSNGEMVSGDLSFNCRCVDQYFVAA